MTSPPTSESGNRTPEPAAPDHEDAPGRTPENRPLRAAIKDTFRWLEYRADPGGEWGPETGFATLDRRDGGIQVRELTLIAGSSLLTLQAFVTSVAAHVASIQKAAVLLLPMTRDGARSAMRFLGQRAGMDPRRLRRGRVTSEEQWLNLIIAADELGQLPIAFDETPYRTLDRLRSRIEDSVRSRPVGLVVLEGAEGLVDDAGVSMPEVCAVLADLARAEGVTILTSLRVPAPRRRSSGPGQMPLGGVLRLARHVDALWCLERHGREVELIVAKGPTGPHRVHLAFDAAASALQERPAPVRERRRRRTRKQTELLFSESDPGESGGPGSPVPAEGSPPRPRRERDEP